MTLKQYVILIFHNQDNSIPINGVSRWYKPWFYTYVQQILENKNGTKRNADDNNGFTEYIPTKDYFHRHNRSIFWMLKYDFGPANHPLFR